MKALRRSSAVYIWHLCVMMIWISQSKGACPLGMYGATCSDPCSIHCLNYCQGTDGTCIDGCASWHVGPMCDHAIPTLPVGFDASLMVSHIAYGSVTLEWTSLTVADPVVEPNFGYVIQSLQPGNRWEHAATVSYEQGAQTVYNLTARALLRGSSHTLRLAVFREHYDLAEQEVFSDRVSFKAPCVAPYVPDFALRTERLCSNTPVSKPVSTVSVLWTPLFTGGMAGCDYIRDYIISHIYNETETVLPPVDNMTGSASFNLTGLGEHEIKLTVRNDENMTAYKAVPVHILPVDPPVIPNRVARAAWLTTAGPNVSSEVNTTATNTTTPAALDRNILRNRLIAYGVGSGVGILLLVAMAVQIYRLTAQHSCLQQQPGSMSAQMADFQGEDLTYSSSSQSGRDSSTRQRHRVSSRN